MRTHSGTQHKRSGLTARVLSAMGAFGGTQLLNILCSVIRAKLVALWIGPAGVGLNALLNSSSELVSRATQLSLRESAVRELAAADEERAALLGGAVLRWGWILGLIGSAIMLLGARSLSLITFGTDSYTLEFAVLCPVPLFTAIGSANFSIIQGSGRYAAIARAMAVAVCSSTVIAVPLLYWLRLQAIPPVIVLFSIMVAVMSGYYRRRHNSSLSWNGSFRSLWAETSGMFRIGIYLTGASAAVTLSTYLFSSYINRIADTDTVGFYQAGFTLVNTYVGLIFSSLAMEYYPRLSKYIHSPRRTSVIVSHQTILLTWVVSLLVVLFLVFDKLAVNILYRSDFETALPFINLGIASVVPRCVSYCFSYYLLAAGKGRTFMLLDIGSTALGLTLNLIGFTWGGFTGLGLSYVLWYLIYALATWLIFRHYGLSTATGTSAVIFLGLAIAFSAVAVKYFMGPLWCAALFLPWLLPLVYKKLRR